MIINNAHDIRVYACKIAELGYQKNTTPQEQRVSSIFGIIHTQMIEYEMTESKQKAFFVASTFIQGDNK